MIIFTVAGPLIGILGGIFDVGIMFWAGVVISSINLFMNLASGVMKLPILPGIFVIFCGPFWSPWYVGASFGLLFYTALEAVGEIVAVMRKPRAS